MNPESPHRLCTHGIKILPTTNTTNICIIYYYKEYAFLDFLKVKRSDPHHAPLTTMVPLT